MDKRKTISSRNYHYDEESLGKRIYHQQHSFDNDNYSQSQNSSRNHGHSSQRSAQELYRPPGSRNHHQPSSYYLSQNHHHYHQRSTYYHQNRLTQSNRHNNNVNHYYQHGNYGRKINNTTTGSSSSNSNYKISKNTQHHHHSEDSGQNSVEIMNQSNDRRRSKSERYEQNFNQFNKTLQTLSLNDQTSVIKRFDLPMCPNFKKSENRMELIKSINNLVLIDSLRNWNEKKSKSQSTAASSSSSPLPSSSSSSTSSSSASSEIKRPSNEGKPGLILLPLKPTMTPKIINEQGKMNDKSRSNAGIIRLNRDTMHQLLQRNSMNENNRHHPHHQQQQQYSHHSDIEKHSAMIDQSPRDKRNTLVTQMSIDFNEFGNLIDRLRYYGGRQNWRNGQSQKFCHTDPNIQAIRIRIMNKCEHLLLIDLNRSTTQNVLPNTWEFCFYDFIRIYRQNNGGNEREMDKEIRDTNLMTTLAREGLDYFGTLYHRIIEKYQFQLKTLYDRHKYHSNTSFYSHLQDITYVVKIIFIYLGDLWRYIEIVPSSSSSSSSTHPSGYFINSKNYYMKAHMLVPKNSHICSQLALVSFYQKNYLDAIYYSIISFEYDIVHDRCSNRFRSKYIRVQSNRQNFLVFFDSVRAIHMKMMSIIRREYDQTMEREKLQRQRLERGHIRINKNYRIEYWVRPDRTIAKCDMYNFYDLAAVVSRNETEPDLYKFYEKLIIKSPSSTTTLSIIAKSQFKDLKDRFTLSFLMAHAMLNYRVGLDRFYDVANQMILEFDSLINRSDNENQCNRLSPFFLIQLFTINMYSVANTMDDHQRDYRSQNAACYGFTQTNSYFVMSTMISIILKRMINLFDTFHRHHNDLIESINSLPLISKGKLSKKLSNEPECVDDFFGSIYHTLITKNSNMEIQQEWYDFYSFLPCIKLWSDWIISFNPYFPPQEMNDIKTPGIDQNVWQIFAQFLTQLHQIKQYPVVFYSDQKSKQHLSLSLPKLDIDQGDYELVQLPEDRCLDGFRILRDTPESSKFVRIPFVSEIAYIYMRIESIKLFGDYLCGLQHPYLRFDTKTSTFESLINTDDLENQPGIKLKQIQQRQLIEAINRDKNNDKIKDNDNNDDDDEYYSNDEEAIREINNLNLNPLERRKLLQYRMFCQHDRKHGHYFRMIEHIHEPKRRFIIIPRYVVFDTNCFINDLSSIMKFVHSKQPSSFIVTVPLIVVQELQSMIARGQRLNNNVTLSSEDIINNDEQQESINLRHKQLAKKSSEILDSLQEAFDSNMVNIRAITSKGSVLDRIDYKEESNNNLDAINNDDLILYGCINLVGKDRHCNDDHIDDKWMRTLLKDAGEQNLTNQDEFIYRDVILITDDMNLRIKSLGFDVPVKKFKQFRKWANTLDHHQPTASKS